MYKANQCHKSSKTNNNNNNNISSSTSSTSSGSSGGGGGAGPFKRFSLRPCHNARENTVRRAMLWDAYFSFPNILFSFKDTLNKQQKFIK